MTSPPLAATVLRPAAEALFENACAWADAVRRPRREQPGRENFDWTVVRHAAETTAKEHGVGYEAIDGSASVVLVDGVWWDLMSGLPPGLVDT